MPFNPQSLIYFNTNKIRLVYIIGKTHLLVSSVFHPFISCWYVPPVSAHPQEEMLGGIPSL
jgi:hypothetical protein